MLALIGLYLWSVAWAIGDAQKRGHSGCWILVLFWLFGPLAALVWLVSRPSTTVVERPPKNYTNPDDALAAASRLDSLGEWESAIGVYQNAAERWPEHAGYVESCIDSIRQKQTLSQ